MNPKFLGWPHRGTRGSEWVTFMSPDAHQPDVKPRRVVKASTVDGCGYILDRRSLGGERSSGVWVWGFGMESRSEVIDVDARVVVDEFVACQRHLARWYKPKIRAAIWSFFSGCLPRSPSLVDLSQCHSFSLPTKARSSLSSLPLLIIDSIGYF